MLTPILLLLYPAESAKTLTAISLTAVFFNATSGSIAYARQGRIDLASGVAFAAAAVPGAVAGALLVASVPRRCFDSLVALMLALLAVWLLTVGRVSIGRHRGGKRVRRDLAFLGRGWALSTVAEPAASLRGMPPSREA